MKKKKVSSDVIVFLFFIILGICAFAGICYLYNKEEINDDYLMTSTTSEESTTNTTLPSIDESEVNDIISKIFTSLSDGVVNNQNVNSETCTKLGNIGYYEDMCVSSNTNCKNIWSYMAPLLMNCYYGNNYPIINGYDENNNISEYILFNKDDFKLLNDYFEIDNKYSDYKDFDLIYSRIINNTNIDSVTKDNFKNSYSKYLNQSYKILFHTNDNIIPSKYNYVVSDISYDNDIYRVTIKATSKDASVSKIGIMNVSIVDNHLKLGKLSFR